jgi:hypothetical protein
MSWNNRRTNWYDSIQPDPINTRYKPQPPYSPAELEKRSEIVWKNIRYVKIPQIHGRIRILPREDGQTVFRSVEYIYDRSYSEAQDQGKRTSRNQKVIIGQEVEEILAGWMLPTENYDRFFDREGNPIPREQKEAAETEERTAAEESQEEKPKEDKLTQEEIREEKTTEEKTKETTQAEKPAEEEPTGPEIKPDEPVGTETDVRLLPWESDIPYYHTAPRSKKQTEQLLTKLLEDASREMLENNRKRLQMMPEDEMTEEERMEYDEMQAAVELRQKDVRRRTLYHLFSPQHLSIEVQTKKHPDAIVSPYKVRKLNQLLSEIMDLYKDTEYAQYLELIEEPERDEQGKILSGMTYSDVDILMNAYEVCLNDYDIFR